jgi:hypothetical protein
MKNQKYPACFRCSLPVLPERLAHVEIVGAGDKPTVTRFHLCLACSAALKTWLRGGS